jgi:FAD/FMN-containing dehydrogenase
MSFRERFF